MCFSVPASNVPVARLKLSTWLSGNGVRIFVRPARSWPIEPCQSLRPPAGLEYSFPLSNHGWVYSWRNSVQNLYADWKSGKTGALIVPVRVSSSTRFNESCAIALSALFWNHKHISLLFRSRYLLFLSQLPSPSKISLWHHQILTLHWHIGFKTSIFLYSPIF